MKNTLFSIFFHVLLINLLSGQTFQLQGFVAEDSSKLLDRAKLTITGSKFQQEIRTDPPNGWYHIALAPGTYDITAEAIGYQSARKTVTIKAADQFLNFDLALLPLPSRLDKDTLQIGMIYDPPLYWFREKIDNISLDTMGITYELVKLLQKELKRPFKYQLVGYLESPALLREGKIDLSIGGFIPSLHYPKDILWSDPFMEADFRLVVPVGSPIRSFEDLKKSDKLVIGHYDEPAVKEWIEKNLPNVQHKGYDISDWYKNLVDGEVDAIINEYPYAKESIKPYIHLLEFTPEPLNHQYYAICISPKDYRLLRAVNTALAKIRKMNSFKKAYKKYLNQEVPFIVKTSVKMDETDMLRYPTRRIYTVQEGDNLRSIAKRYLGNEIYWKKIWRLNFTRYELDGLNEVKAGTTLRLPSKIDQY